ncbi:MAG: VWA domain-containing protein [Pyrinomonadaceae bacterium]|nr:VWA domain-containing protein [Pyrinomonadaceae bacterium]
MKRIVAALIFTSLFGISVFSQTTKKTRPRIIQNPAPQQQNDRNKPPVLVDKNSTSVYDDEEPPPPIVLPPVEDDEIIKIETNLVTMPVTVLDRNGRFVSNLQQRDFQIFENNVEQQVGFFQRVETPFTVILMIDVSPSTQYKIDEIQNAAITFVNQLRRDDKVMVIAFDERVNILSRATSDRNQLRRAIQQARFGDGTSLYDAVDQVVNRELRYIDGRKAVVVFTDGVDTTSKRATYQSAVREVEEVDAIFYPIRYDTFKSYSGGGSNQPTYPRRRRSSGGWGGILGDILGGIVIGGTNPTGGGGGVPAGSTRGEYETGKRFLEDLARNSGGRNFEANTTYNLDSAFAGIAEELRQQYQIGYYPSTIGRTGDRKSIRVRVMRPNLVVRAKTSYIVGENASSFAGR